MKAPLKRGAGILLPISSLSSPYGIGTLGKDARKFIDRLHRAGQTYWQVLPVGPTSYGDSPYQSFSAFAGNPYFIDLDTLARDGLLTARELAGHPGGPPGSGGLRLAVRDAVPAAAPGVRAVRGQERGVRGLLRRAARLAGRLRLLYGAQGAVRSQGMAAVGRGHPTAPAGRGGCLAAGAVGEYPVLAVLPIPV